MIHRFFALLAVLGLSLSLLVAAPSVAQAGVPGSYQTCSPGSGYGSGTVKALYGGRKMQLAMTRGSYLLTPTKRATTRAYTSSGNLLWVIDYRYNPSSYLTYYTFNRDSQAHRSGTYIVTTFHWARVGAFDKRCTAYSRIP